MRNLPRFTFILAFVTFTIHGKVHAAARLEPLTVGYSNITATYAPHPSLQVVKVGLEMLSLQYPQAKQTDANQIIDPSFMKKIEDSGFIRALAKK